MMGNGLSSAESGAIPMVTTAEYVEFVCPVCDNTVLVKILPGIADKRDRRI